MKDKIYKLLYENSVLSDGNVGVRILHEDQWPVDQILKLMEEAVGEDYEFTRPKEDYLPAVYQFLRGKNELREEIRERLKG